MPLKVNFANVMPIIFAGAILMFPEYVFRYFASKPDASTIWNMVSAVNGPVTVGKADDASRSIRLAAGETALIPACFGAYVIVPEKSGETTVVKTTL